MNQKWNRFLKNPYALFSVLANRGWFDWLGDEGYLRLQYRARMGRWPDLKRPVTYNEKLQWLKLHDRRKEYTVLADKYAMRGYVAEKIGEEYTIPLLGVWETPEDIDFDALPDQFVLKCNHNSGRGMCICRDKSRLDIPAVRKELARGLAQDYYKTCREWPYKDIKRRIIAERYMKDGADKDLTDYKFFCFHGEPKIMYITRENSGLPGMDFFDMEFRHLPILMEDAFAEVPPEKPARFEEMKQLAKILSAGIPHVRVDFYLINGRIYVGELTFFHGGGYDRIQPEEWARTLGDWIRLPME